MCLTQKNCSGSVMNCKTIPCIFTLAFLCFATGCRSQNKPQNKIHVGGNCEGCQLMYDGMPDKLNSSDTSAAWKENDGQKFIISGTVFQANGTTPAKDVILYYYHTDNSGKYTPRPGQPAQRHGHLRGWVKIDSRGRYSIYTIKPMHYPNETFAAHIHVILKEPGFNEYYLDEWVFDDDRYLTAEVKNRYEKRGGNGIMHAELKEGIWKAEQNVTCGLNIPNYPGK